MNKLPLQTKPVNRGEIITPHLSVDLKNGKPEIRLNIYLDLIHGANFNDPQPFRGMSYAHAKYTA